MSKYESNKSSDKKELSKSKPEVSQGERKRSSLKGVLSEALIASSSDRAKDIQEIAVDNEMSSAIENKAAKLGVKRGTKAEDTLVKSRKNIRTKKATKKK